MVLKQISPEVFSADAPIVRVSRKEIEFLKERNKGTSRGRIRLCAHPNNDDPLHEMFIVLAKETYIRPHKHLAKSESFHVLEGIADVVLFDDSGNLIEIIEMGDFASGHNFFYRLSKPFFHTLIIRSSSLVLHETTNGPFDRGSAQFATWSPDESDPLMVRDFMSTLATRVQAFSK